MPADIVSVIEAITNSVASAFDDHKAGVFFGEQTAQAWPQRRTVNGRESDPFGAGVVGRFTAP